MADLKISQLPTFTPPLQSTDLFPASQFIGTPGAQTNKVPWGNILSQIQGSSFPSLSISGLTGATDGTRYVGATVSGSPVSGTFIAGDFVVDKSGSMWVCTAGGTPGTWASVSGPSVNQWTASGNYLRPTATGTIEGIQLFPLTPSTGSLKVLSTSNSGNVDAVITNAIFGQTSTITIPDPGVSSSSFILANNPSAQTINTSLLISGGNLFVTSGTIIAGGDITAGLSGGGTPGKFKSFPNVTNTGYLALEGVPSSGNFNTTISNAAMGQSSTISIPDPGAATANFILSQSPTNQAINSTVSVAGLTSTGSINAANAAALTATTGINLFSGNSDYRIGFDNNGATKGWIRLNVGNVSAIHGWAFTAGTIADPLSASAIIQSDSTFILGANAQGITPQAALHIAQGGYFGTTVLANGNITSAAQVIGMNGWLSGVFGGTSGNRVVMGLLNGAASLGGHNFALNAWAPLYILPEAQSNLAVGLSAVGSQTPNAQIHGAKDTILGIPSAALPDASLYASNIHPWIDETNNVLNFKIKKSGGSVITIPVNSEEGYNYKTTIATTTYSATASDLVILGDTTGGSFTITVDATLIKKELLIFNYSGAAAITVAVTGGQFINGSSSSIVLSVVGQFIRLTSNGTANMYCSGSSDKYRTLTSDGSVLYTDNVLLLDSSSGNVNLTVDVTKLINPIRVVRISATGTNTTSFQASGGQTINGLSTAITMATQFTTAEISFIGGTSGCITGSAVG